MACIKEKRHLRLPSFLRHVSSRLHAETGCRKICAREVFEKQQKSMEGKETIRDGGGRNYANSQFSNQNRQDAISRAFFCFW